MTNRQPIEKTVKQIQKEIEKLRAEYKKTEFPSCHGDLDLFQKDKDLGLLKDKINTLQKEPDTHLYTWSRKVQL